MPNNKLAGLSILISKRLEGHGYMLFNDFIPSPARFFYKALQDEIILGLALFPSGVENKFVANFFVTKTIHWQPSIQMIPENSVCGLYSLLDEAEKSIFCNPDDSLLQQWSYKNSKDVNNFISSLSISEKRLINQKDLIKSVNENIFFNEMKFFVSQTQKKVEQLSKNNFPFFKPKKEVLLNFSSYWIKAARITLFENGGIQNESTAISLAQDAFVQYQLFKLKNKN